MSEIICITICVNYSDILKHVIHQNLKFFKTWYIVTSIDDTETFNLVKKVNSSNICILMYSEFYKDNLKFNKGGALKFAQTYVNTHHSDSNILILDADIFLPDSFITNVPEKLEDDTLYGTSERLDYWSLNDYNTNQNPHIYQWGNKQVGFFQLYKQCLYTYEDSFNASECDLTFRNKFNTKKNLENLSVKHLGKDFVNWNGRVWVLDE